MTVIDSTIADNSAGAGGGIDNEGTMTVTNSTIADNSAFEGGGISIYGTTTITSSTIAYNSINGGGGGGLFLWSGNAILDNTIVALNTGAITGGTTPDDIFEAGGPASSSSAYNLIGTGGSGGLVNGVNGNQVGVADPGLDPNGLQDNGGPTQTIALLAGSPAIDAGSNSLAVDPTTGQPLAFDQRGPGFPRIANGNVDFGAFEFEGPFAVVTTQPPGSVTAGAGFGLTVTAEDGSGNVVSSFDGTVTVALSNNPGGATLGGTLTVTAQSGVATFSGLTLDTAATGYTLLVSANGLADGTTNAFDVTAAAATHLVVTTQPPSSVTASYTFGLVVSAEDPFDNVNPTFSGGVSVALSNNPGGATLGGTLTATARSGVATFSDLTLNQAGTGYTLQVSSNGLTAATTSAFNVTPVVATQLVMTTEPPSSITAGSEFGLVVTADDNLGHVATTFSGSVTVALWNNPGGATLGGTLTATARSGVAIFSGLILDKAGTGYTLQVTGNWLASATTSAFDVTAAAATQLVVTTQPPGSVTASYTFGLVVSAEDPYGNVDPTFNGGMAVALSNNPGGATLGGTLTATAQSGVATFTGLTLEKAGTGYTLLVSGGGLTGITSPFNVTAAAATQLIITQSPASATAGAGFSLVAAAGDPFGNVNATFGGSVSVALLNNPGGATLGGTLTVMAQSGVATFSGLTLDKLGTGYTLLVSTNGLPAATTDPFDVTAVGSTYTVSSLGDNGTGSGLSGDLRYVITQADSNVGCTIDFSVAGTIYLVSALPDLNRDVTLNGPGAAKLTVARSGAAGTAAFRIFTIDTNTKVKIDGLTITGGLASQGGGLSIDGGTVSLTNVSVINNQAVGPEGAAGSAGSPGASGGRSGYGRPHDAGPGGDGGPGSNGGNALGGGIYMAGGSLTLNNDVVSSNVARGGAGGVGGVGGDGGGWPSGPEVRYGSGGPGGGGATGGKGGNGGAGGSGEGGGLYVSAGNVTIVTSHLESDLASGGPGGVGGRGGDGGAGGRGSAGFPGYGGWPRGTGGPGGNGGSGGSGGEGGLGGAGGSGDGGGLYVAGGIISLSGNTISANSAVGGSGGPAGQGGIGGTGGIGGRGGTGGKGYPGGSGGTGGTGGGGGGGGHGGNGGQGNYGGAGGGAYGGALYVAQGTVALTFDTFNANSALGGQGGGGGHGGTGGYGGGGGNGGRGGTGGNGAEGFATSGGYVFVQPGPGGHGGRGGVGGAGGTGGRGGTGGSAGSGGVGEGGGLYISSGSVSLFGDALSRNSAFGGAGAVGGVGGMGAGGGGGGVGGSGGPGGGWFIFVEPHGGSPYVNLCCVTTPPAPSGSAGGGGSPGNAGPGGEGGQGGDGGSGSGGGVFVGSGSVTITNSTVASDVAQGGPVGPGGGGGVSGGSIHQSGGTGGPGQSPGMAQGAGIHIADGNVSLTNSTIAGNHIASGGAGGGVDVEAGTAALYNSIVALNTDGTGSGAPADDIAGTVAPASAYNLIGTGGSGGLVNNVNGNLIGVADPGLDPNGLQSNGGPTQTIALLPGSPAIGAGSDNIPGVSVPTKDQRGVIRPPDRIDIGAFQDRGFQFTLVAGSSPQRTAVNTAFPNPLAVTVTSPYGDPVVGGVIAFTVTPSQGGASATLSASDATIVADGQASVTATANGTVGGYTVTASPAGAKPRAQFRLRNAPATAGAGGSARTAAIPIVILGAIPTPADPGTDPARLGIPRVPLSDGRVTELAAGLLTASGSIGAGDSPIVGALNIADGGASSLGNGRAGRASAPRAAPRAEILLAGRGRGWSLGASTKARTIGLASAETS